MPLLRKGYSICLKDAFKMHLILLRMRYQLWLIATNL